jgi:uncharacterized protein (TIGR00369 family)
VRVGRRRALQKFNHLRGGNNQLKLGVAMRSSFEFAATVYKSSGTLQEERFALMPVMSAEELNTFVAAHFPHLDENFRVEEVEDRAARVRLLYHDRHLRPGETISGASLMALADLAMYVTLLGMIGPVALAVTTNLNINFLRKPAKVDVVAQCRLLKLGKRLAVGEVIMRSEGDTEPVAHATVTYSIPPG